MAKKFLVDNIILSILIEFSVMRGASSGGSKNTTPPLAHLNVATHLCCKNFPFSVPVHPILLTNGV